MIDVPSVSAAVAAIGVLIGVAIAILQLRDLVKTRQTDLVIRLYSTMGSRDFQEAWEKFRVREFKDISDYEKRYGWVEAYEVGIFFEGIGVLLYRKLIDIGLVADLFSSPIKMTSEKMRPMAKAYRKILDLTHMGEYFEYLYNEMQKREQTLQTQQ